MKCLLCENEIDPSDPHKHFTQEHDAVHDQVLLDYILKMQLVMERLEKKLESIKVKTITYTLYEMRRAQEDVI
jgi:hypothetical protein